MPRPCGLDDITRAYALLHKAAQSAPPDVHRHLRDDLHSGLDDSGRSRQVRDDVGDYHGTYRILYLLDEEAGIVEVTVIRHRADAYRT